MNALPLGSRFLAHVIGTVALIWRSMLRAACIAGGVGFVVAEIADCIVARHFPPSILALWVALVLALGLAYGAAATVLLIEIIGSVATTIRHLEGDARAGLGAAETLAALEAGRFFLRHDRAQAGASASTTTTATTATTTTISSHGGANGQSPRYGTTGTPTSARRPVPSQQRTNGTSPLLSATNTSANSTGRAATGRPRTIGDAANLARHGVSSGSTLRPVSQWPVADGSASTPSFSTPITPFAEGELVPQLPPLPVRADRLPRIEWANVEDASQEHQEHTDPTRARAESSAAARAVETPTPPPAERAPDEDTLAALAAPAWGPQFDEGAIGSNAPTIVPTLSQAPHDIADDWPTTSAHPDESAPPTTPRQGMPTRPLSRSMPRPSGPFDVPTQGGGLWERLGQALRGQAEQVTPAATSDSASATEGPRNGHAGS